MKKGLIILIMFSLIACEKVTDWSLHQKYIGVPVIDAIITDEYKHQSISITKTVTDLNDSAEAISGANVFISTPDSIWFFTEDPNKPGHYRSNKKFKARFFRTYTLNVTYDNEVYVAFTKMAPVTPFNILSYAKNPNNNFYFVTWVASPFDVRNPAKYEVLIDWSEVPDFGHLDPDSCKALLYYYSVSSIDVAQFFAPQAEKVIFPKGSKIIEKKYSLNQEHAEFIRSLLLETKWTGGIFDSSPANVESNISNGALGFFAASAVLSDSLIVQ